MHQQWFKSKQQMVSFSGASHNKTQSSPPHNALLYLQIDSTNHSSLLSCSSTEIPKDAKSIFASILKSVQQSASFSRPFATFRVQHIPWIIGITAIKKGINIFEISEKLHHWISRMTSVFSHDYYKRNFYSNKVKALSLRCTLGFILKHLKYNFHCREQVAGYCFLN